MDIWIHCGLSALVTIVHGFQLPLSSLESEGGCVFSTVSCEGLVVPLGVLKLCFSNLSHLDWDSKLFAFTCIELICSFISSALVHLVLEFAIQPASGYGYLLLESCCWGHPLVLSLGHSSKVRELETWLKMFDIIQLPFGSEIHVC